MTYGAASVDPMITNVELSAHLSVKPGISGTMTLPVSDLTRAEALGAFLAENPNALPDVPRGQELRIERRRLVPHQSGRPHRDRAMMRVR